MEAPTMNISAKDVMALREKTGLGMMDCKEALAKNNNDMKAAEDAIADVALPVALVAIDSRTGAVRAVANNPSGFDRALLGAYAPGSTFKVLTSIAGLRRSVLTPNEAIVDCTGWLRVGNTRKPCYNGKGVHHDVHLPTAIAQSCDIYYYTAGQLMGVDQLAAEARRFKLDRRTGIELPGEQERMIIPDTQWKRRVRNEPWYPGDTANVSIGQGDVLITPLGMACFIASVARDETTTQPTLVHLPNRPRQRSEPIGLTVAQRSALLEGMLGCTTYGTAKNLSQVASYRIPGVAIAGKTGTAQVRVLKDGKVGTINLAWFICFAPIEKPEIAMAVMVEGDTIGEETSGGFYAAPIAAAVMKKYFDKKNNPERPLVSPVKTE